MNVLDFPEGQHLKAVDASPWSGSILRVESLQEASCPEEQRLTCSRSWGQTYPSLQAFKFAFLPQSKNHCKDCYVRPMPSDHGAGRNADMRNGFDGTRRLL